jgi:hypothetical protein
VGREENKREGIIMKKRICSIILAFCLIGCFLPAQTFAATIVAQGNCGKDIGRTNLSWTLDSNGLLTISGTGEMEDYTTYTSYYSPWFLYKDSIKALKIDSEVTSVGNYAFYQCGNISGTLILPNGITRIGEKAFKNCTGFTGSLTLPSSLLEIGNDAFWGCTGFNGQLILAEGLQKIGICAFQDCSGFNGELKIPRSTATIGSGAFTSCRGFTGQLTITNGVTSIGSVAFKDCTGLYGTVIIPQSLISIGGNFIADCSGLNAITVDTNNPNYSSLQGILYNKQCTEVIRCPEGKTGNISIADDASIIDDQAFSNCSGITGILTLPAGITNIGRGAFENCGGLTGQLIIPNKVQNIDNLAFSNCTGFTGMLEIPNSVTTIGQYTFQNCCNLTGLSIGDKLKSIGNFAFNLCSGFKGSLIIPDSIFSIGEHAFSKCGFTESLVIPDSVSGIPAEAFSDCIGFKGKLILPSNLKSIGNGAFRNCSGFTGNVEIPEGVTNIDSNVFHGCKGLSGACFYGDAPTVTNASSWSSSFPDSITLYYLPEKTGWSSPTWNGYKTATWTAPVRNQTKYNVAFSYRATNGNSDRSYSGLVYQDVWLTQDSYIYNHDLAIMSLALAMAGFGSHGSEKDANIKTLYSNLGFDGSAYLSVGYDKEDKDTVAAAIDSKKIVASDGSVVPLIAVTLRGNDYGDGGWAGNFEIGDYGPYHVGFAKAAKYAETQLKNYLENHNYDTSNVRIWLTGYSRSAATANLLSQFIRVDGLCRRENIYTYTFATPSNELLKYTYSSYNNIFNIINPLDIVPMVPPRKWLFGKAGTTYQIPDEETSSSDMYKSFKTKFYNLTGAQYASVGKQRMITSALLSTLTDNLSSRNVYTANLEKALVDWKLGDASALDSILCGKTSMEQIKTLLSKNNLTSYIELYNEFKNVYDYRKETFGSSDPYIGLIDDLLEIALRAAYEMKRGNVGTENMQMLNYLLNVIESNSSSAAFMQHWPEVYLSWMSITSQSNLTQNSEYKIVKVSCPVDVSVYDGSGKLAVQTGTDTFTDDDGISHTVSVIKENNMAMEIGIAGENKIFVLPADGNYSIKIGTNETYQNGDTMDVSFTNYADGIAMGETDFNNVLLLATSTFSSDITAEGTEAQNYSLSDGSHTIAPTTVISSSDKDESIFRDVDICLEKDRYYHVSGILPAFNTDVTVYYALYSSSGQMLAVCSQTILSTNTDRKLSGKLAAQNNAEKIKIFAISSESSLKPVNMGTEILLQ